MYFDYEKSVEILTNTPKAVSAILNNLSEYWIDKNEGGSTWTAKQVVAHLIVCEQTDWVPRIQIILNDHGRVFAPIDMHAHYQIASNNDLASLLNKFSELRMAGLRELELFNLKDADFKKEGIHPSIGPVSLQQIISAWVTHDLTHISQIARVMAKQNSELVGGFRQYLKILN
jgi:hypothetical protein